MAYVVYNVFSDSNVSHTESSLGVTPYDMVWETRKEAKRHAYNLTIEYGFSHPHLPQEQRVWAVRPATPEQVQRAKFVGAFGQDYEDIIGTGQTRAHITDPSKLPEKVADDMRKRVEDYRERQN